MKKERVAVTGATGFVGKRLCQMLVEKGYDVVALGRNREVGVALQQVGCRFVEVEMRDLAGLGQAVEGVGTVVHAAAKSTVWGKYSEFYDSNVLGTENVIDACRRKNVQRLIYVSSSSVYFDFRDRFDIKETDPLAESFASHYTETKALAEQRVRSAEGLEWMILRPRGIFGPGDQAIVPRALRIARKGYFPLVRGGEVLVDLTYVDNLVDAIEAGLGAGSEAWNEVYNVSNGEPVRIVDFFDAVMEGLGMSPKKVFVPMLLLKLAAVAMEGGARVLASREPALTRYTAGLLSYHQTLDTQKTKALLGYEAKVSVEEGIRRTVSAMREDGWK